MIYTVTLNPARDRTVVISDFAAGKVNRIKSFRDDPGGKGINVSKVIKSLGGRSVAMGILGGSTGEYIRNCLDEMGIENDFVFVEAETRTNIKVFDDKNLVTTDINEAGSPVSEETLGKVLEKILENARKGDMVVFAGKIPAGAPSDLLQKWIGTLKQNGVSAVLDADSRTLKEGVKAAPMLIKPNEIELGELLGETLDSADKIVKGAKRVMAENGIAFVAVSMGADGAVFVTEKAAYRAMGLKIDAKSTVGAGDAMAASLAYGIDAGMDEIDACRLSIAASAAAVMCEGTQSADRKTIDELYQKVEIFEI
ncbi:MAG: 1-phosphofructokinase [Clostridia bacterium]|nr:1-phosphofructokinase [Clostridia bacterium]